jgi:L-aminopeptidase/D-esterase-like protein
MLDGITDVRGIAVGHAQDRTALTGCTVVLAGAGGVVGADVRGLAPGTRETDLCRPEALVEKAQAVLLTGGSAYGLDAAGGVMSYLREHGVGYQMGALVVPIVPAAVIFDLGIGEPAWPDGAMGYKACETASTDAVEQGVVGAGTGATVGKFLGPALAMKSGVGTASTRVGNVAVGALMVVNAGFNVVDPWSGKILAGARDPETGRIISADQALLGATPGTNTTIGVVATDAALSKVEVARMASAAHDGFAHAIHPVHTLYDGDTVFALATGEVVEDVPHPVALHLAVVDVVQRAIVNAVVHARGAGGLPSAVDMGTVDWPDPDQV